MDNDQKKIRRLVLRLLVLSTLIFFAGLCFFAVMRVRVPQQRLEKLPGLMPVAGQINPHPGDGAHGGDILGGMMAHAQRTVADAAADADELLECVQFTFS